MIIKSDKYRRRYGKFAVGGISVNYNRGNPARQRECETEPMELSDLTPEQLGVLLFKVNNHSRAIAKRYLYELGCPNRSEDLDKAIELAEASDAAIQEADRVEGEVQGIKSELDVQSSAEKDRLIALISSHIEASGMGQVEFAQKITWQPMVLSKILSGRKRVSVEDLCRLAIALGLKIDISKKN